MRGNNRTNEEQDAHEESVYCETFAMAELKRERPGHSSEEGPDRMDAILQALHAGFLDGESALQDIPEEDNRSCRCAAGTHNEAWGTRKNDIVGIEAFLVAHTFACAGLRARITRSQCRHNVLSGTVPGCTVCPQAIVPSEPGAPTSPDKTIPKGGYDVDFQN